MSSSRAWRKRPVTRALGMAPSSMTNPFRGLSRGFSSVPRQSMTELMVGPMGFFGFGFGFPMALASKSVLYLGGGLETFENIK